MENLQTTNIGDYFWAPNHTFDFTDTGLMPGRSGLLYLHGGVHMWQNTMTGTTGKWTNQGTGSLLSVLNRNFRRSPNRQPLIVSEGTSAQKLHVIRRSDYLSFARQQLNDDASDTVIFGASFSDQDQHIVAALRSGGRRRIAISVYPGTQVQNTETMARYKATLPDQDLVFFDSRTHPLGDPALKVP